MPSEIRHHSVIHSLFLFFASCSPAQKTTPQVVLTEAGQKEIVKWETRYQTVTKNLTAVQGILVIGAVGALVACFMGAAKFAAPVFAACLLGYGLVSAGIYYPHWVALFGLIGGVFVCGYAIHVNRRAFKEVVACAQGVKNYAVSTLDADKTGLNNILKASQHKATTEELVKKIKVKENII